MAANSRQTNKIYTLKKEKKAKIIYFISFNIYLLEKELAFVFRGTGASDALKIPLQ